MRVKILNEYQIQNIHEKSLEILEKVGIRIPHMDILSFFDKEGADVNFNKNQVNLPKNLVMELISKAGRNFTLYGRDLTKKAEFGMKKRNYNTTAGQAFWIDEIGEERR